MNEKSNSERGGQTSGARADRLKAALKANLARRKAQTRERARALQENDQAPDETGQEKDG